MNQLKRALYLNLVILCLVCLILISLRFINTISFLEPFHSQTGGAEDTGFLAIWLIKIAYGIIIILKILAYT